MPGLLELLGLKRPARVEDEGIEMREMGLTVQESKLLAGIPVRLAYARKNAPDEAVRLLAQMASELKEVAKRRPLDAEALQRQVDDAIITMAAKARKAVSQHCGHWINDWDELSKPLEDDAPEARKQRAADLLHFINEATGGIQRDRDTIGRVEKHAPGSGIASLLPVLEEQSNNVLKAREAWEELLPKRQSKKEPTLAKEVSRPQPSGVKNPKKWSEACDRIDLASAKGEAPKPEDLKLMAEGAQQALDADTDWKWEADIKEKFGCNWDQVKGKFKSLKKADLDKATAFMSGYWWFRKLTVDAEMKKLADQYKFTWESVGSTNLESDYDITVMTHGKDGEKTVWDWQIVAKFNSTLSARFKGVQPGTLFDTNLYASAALEPLKGEHEKSPTEKDMDAMAEAGQDVGALMKMRRFMSWDDYTDYQDAVVAEIDKAIKTEKDKERLAVLQRRRDAALRQFDTADALYFKKLTQTLDHAKIKYDPGLADTPEGQKKLIEMIEELEKNPDKLMAATNSAYVEAIEGVRKIAADIMALDKALKLLEGKEDLPSRKKLTELLDLRAATLARLETFQADAVYFAAEAYHSKGPFQHIVQAGQKSAQEVKADSSIPKEQQKAEIGRRIGERLKLLPLTAFLQSFNEQLGDFLKDLKHYDEKSPFPGMGLYRSSKYLERFCEAMDWIGKKLEGDESLKDASEEFKLITIAGKTPLVVKAGLGKLVDLRGGKVEFTDVDDAQQEAEAYALEEAQKIFGSGMKTLSDLGNIAKGVGKQVNVVVRKAEVAQKMIAESEKAYFK